MKVRVKGPSYVNRVFLSLAALYRVRNILNPKWKNWWNPKWKNSGSFIILPLPALLALLVKKEKKKKGEGRGKGRKKEGKEEKGKEKEKKLTRDIKLHVKDLTQLY